MKKPHEQEWRTKTNEGETACAVYDAQGLMVADLRLAFTVEAEAERARFIAAAPDMARALMALVDAAGDTDIRFTIPGPLEQARTALRKAGVL